MYLFWVVVEVGVGLRLVGFAGLAEPNSGKHEDRSGELADGECLVEDDPAGQGGDEGAEETKDADLGDREELDPAEPEAKPPHRGPEIATTMAKMAFV